MKNWYHAQNGSQGHLFAMPQYAYPTPPNAVNKNPSQSNGYNDDFRSAPADAKMKNPILSVYA